MLASVIRKYWHALARDVMALGYRVSDMFTTLSFHEMLCIVVGSHPTTSVRFFLDSGWSREAHLLANMAEEQAGVSRIHEAYDRPGVDQRERDPNSSELLQADAMTWTEMDEVERRRYADDAPVGTNRVRVI